MSDDEVTGPQLTIEYEDESYVIGHDDVFDVGREADLSLDHNPYLHRKFLRISYEGGFWWITNVGHGLGATVYDQNTRLQAWLGPSSRLPLVFSQVEVVFTAGPCAYKLVLVHNQPRWQEGLVEVDADGDTTLRGTGWTESQRLAVLALAEPMLARESFGVVQIPSNAVAADRIQWSVKRFEKKIDNVCSKLDKLGVDGLRGGVHQHASGRRARLVEWAISTGFVTSADLYLLDMAESIPDDD